MAVIAESINAGKFILNRPNVYPIIPIKKEMENHSYLQYTVLMNYLKLEK